MVYLCFYIIELIGIHWQSNEHRGRFFVHLTRLDGVQEYFGLSKFPQIYRGLFPNSNHKGYFIIVFITEFDLPFALLSTSSIRMQTTERGGHRFRVAILWLLSGVGDDDLVFDIIQLVFVNIVNEQRYGCVCMQNVVSGSDVTGRQAADGVAYSLGSIHFRRHMALFWAVADRSERKKSVKN